MTFNESVYISGLFGAKSISGFDKTMKRKRHKITKPPLQIADFICRRCRVQATRDADHICGICKALGKCAEPETQNASRRDGSLAAMLAKSVNHWFIDHHLIALNETLTPAAKER